jgi:hypothetical protein
MIRLSDPRIRTLPLLSFSVKRDMPLESFEGTRLSNLSGWEFATPSSSSPQLFHRSCCALLFHCAYMPRLLAVQKSVCLENKVLVILVPRTRGWHRDTRSAWHSAMFLNEMKRVHRVNDHFVISAHDQRQMLDVLQIREPLALDSSPLTDGCDLRRRDLIVDRSVALLPCVRDSASGRRDQPPGSSLNR